MRPRRILAAAGRAGRRYWWQILAVSIPVSLVGSGLEIITDHYVDPSDALLSISSSLGSTAITLLGTVLLSGFVTRLVSAAEHGREPLTLPQVARSLPWWRLVGADILVSVLVVIGFVLLIVPGFIALTRLAVTGPVVEIEHRRVFAAIRRSRQLTRRHTPTVLLLATAPLAISAELEAIAPEPDRVGEIAQFLLIRGLAVGVVEACIAVVLCELCYQLIATQAAQQALDQPGPSRGLPVRAARPEPEPDHDAESHQQQPRGEKDVYGDAEHDQGDDGDEDQAEYPGHVMCLRFRSASAAACLSTSRLPPRTAAVDQDQPWSHPGTQPEKSGSSLTGSPALIGYSSI